MSEKCIIEENCLDNMEHLKDKFVNSSLDAFSFTASIDYYSLVLYRIQNDFDEHSRGSFLIDRYI